MEHYDQEWEFLAPPAGIYARYRGPDSATLPELRDWVFGQAEGPGCHCPVCERIVKIRRYRVYAKNVEFLESLLHEQESNAAAWVANQGFVRVNRKGSRLPGIGLSNGYANTKFFGLLFHLGPEKEFDTRGFWRVSQFGKAFLEGRETIPRHVWVYNNEILAASKENVTVDQCREAKWSKAKIYAHYNKVDPALLRHDWKPRWMVVRR